MAKIAVIYYSSTGNTYRLAKLVAEGAESVGAEVRLRRVAELAPENIINDRPEWRDHLDDTRAVPEATPADLEWADGFVLGTPTRFGLPSAQLKKFIDLCGGLWATGKLQDKAAGVFGGASNRNGGQESTLLALQNVFYHWGAVIVPVGYTHPCIADSGGNPYGVSVTSSRDGELPDSSVAAARYQGSRIARFADVLIRNQDSLRDPVAQ